MIVKIKDDVKTTTINVTKETCNKLRELKEPKDTYEHVIKKLLSRSKIV